MRRPCFERWLGAIYLVGVGRRRSEELNRMHRQLVMRRRIRLAAGQCVMAVCGGSSDSWRNGSRGTAGREDVNRQHLARAFASAVAAGPLMRLRGSGICSWEFAQARVCCFAAAPSFGTRTRSRFRHRKWLMFADGNEVVPDCKTEFSIRRWNLV